MRKKKRVQAGGQPRSSSIKPGRLRTAAWLACLIAGATGVAGAQDRSRLVQHYDCRVQWENASRAQVSVTISVEGLGESDALPGSFVMFYGAQIEDVMAQSGEARIALSVHDRVESFLAPANHGIATAGDPATYSLEYRVEGQPPLTRIPLPVPDLSTPIGERVVHILVQVPDGWVPTGDTFPSFTWQSRREGQANLGSVPSFVLVSLASGNSIPASFSLLNPTRLVDAILLALILGGALAWWLRAKRSAK
jgi:hypothetical protein